MKSKLLVAVLAVWAVTASAFVAITASKLSHAERKFTKAESDSHDEMTAALHRLLMDFQYQEDRCKGASIHAFHFWLPLAKRTEDKDGTIIYSWTRKPPQENMGSGVCFIKVDRDERVLEVSAEYLSW